MKDASPLSIVVPVHDRADLAARALGALELWETPIELVVVDDGSREAAIEDLRRSVEAAAPRSPRRVRWLRNETALGFSAAINRGIAETEGDPILLLNSDAEVRAGGDRALLAAFARPLPSAGNPPGGAAGGATTAIGAVAARLVFPDGRPQWSGGAEPTLAWLFAQASGLGAKLSRFRRAPSGFTGGAVDWAPAAALALRRTAWEATGPFDESFAHYAQDLDYGHRLRQRGFGIVIEPAFEVAHHFGGSSGGQAVDSQRLDLLWGDLLRFIGKSRGEAALRRARRAVRLGARVRQTLLLAAGRRPEARRVGAALAVL
jgi:GT2 family glycosyltransferase